jgi:hypothetical protein
MITSVDRISNNLPQYFSLSQNYPNPFNPSTTIKYELPGAANVKLIVYNMLGEIVTTLVNEQKPAGTYTVQFDGSGLSSGVYFCRFYAKGESGKEFSKVMKMMMLK